MKKSFHQIARVLSLVLILSGCGPAYQSAANGGLGYSDLQMTKNIYKITYQGGLSTDLSQVESFALYRAAELMLQNGFNRFRVLRSQTHQMRLQPDSPIVIADQHSMGAIQTKVVTHLPHQHASYITELTVEGLQEGRIDEISEVYVATEVIDHLQKRLNLKTGKK